MVRSSRLGIVIVGACALGAVVACSSSNDAPVGDTSCDTIELLVAASDYASSKVCGVPSSNDNGGCIGAVNLGHDPMLSASSGRAFFLVRDMDQIFELDPKCGTPLHEYSVHDNAMTGAVNPHDLAVAPDGSLFVVLYNVPRIAILTKDGKLDGTIDLSSYDADHNPEADAIRIVSVNGVAKAFVTLERLTFDGAMKRFISTQPSSMLRIDVATRKIEAKIDLKGLNPFNVMAEQDGALFLAEPGDFDSATDTLAGIERFDTATSTSRIFITEKDLGGSVSEIAVTAGCGAAIVAGPKTTINPTSLVTFDPATGKVLTTATTAAYGPTDGYDLQGLAWRGNSLFVGDRRASGTGYRVHVFERDPNTCTLHESVEKTILLPQKPVALRSAQTP